MKRYTNELKQEIINLHLENKLDIKQIARKLNISYPYTKELIYLYRSGGFDAIKLKKQKTIYTLGEKQKILKEQETNNLTNCEIAAKYNTSPSRIKAWKKLKDNKESNSFSKDNASYKIINMKNKSKQDDFITLTKDEFIKSKKKLKD